MPASGSYDNRKEQLVHQLIEAIFSGREFDRFCQYYYPALYYQFTQDIGNDAKIRMLVEYAVQYKQLGKLINSIQNTKPQEYHAFVQCVRASANASGPASSASSLADPPDRTIRPAQYTDKKRLGPTWAWLVVLIAFLFFASEPLYLIIKPLSADTNPTIQKAIVIVEKVISQEAQDMAQADQAATAEATDQTKAWSDGDNDQATLINNAESFADIASENLDTDGDGLDDKTEIEVLKTNPQDPDTDSDGLRDDDEIRWGFDPLSWDTDGDGTSDSTEADPGQMTSATLTPVPIPGPQFKETSYSVNEWDGQATVTVRLAAMADEQVIINYSTIENGTAKAGEDYTTTSGRLVFNPGQTNGVFKIPIINDSNNEQGETVGLELSGSGQTNLGPNTSQSTLMIIDDDVVGVRFSQVQPSLTLLQAEPLRYLVGEDQQAIIDVELTALAGQQIRVGYATEDGSARAGEDYIPVNSMLTFSPGETRKRFSVHILPDGQPEDPEIIILILRPETGVDAARVELVIVDSD